MLFAARVNVYARIERRCVALFSLGRINVCSLMGEFHYAQFPVAPIYTLSLNVMVLVLKIKRDYQQLDCVVFDGCYVGNQAGGFSLILRSGWL